MEPGAPINLEHVARLARLDVEPADIGPLTEALTSILQYAQQLGELDLDNVEPLAHAADLDAVLAPDEVVDGLPKGTLEAMAPSMDGPFISVPKVLGGGSGA